ncbi:putative PPPDE peptidase domain-containing protein [Helianthus debilis subsp. tardiflorus]
MRFRQAKTEIVTASKVAYRFLAGISSNNTNPGSPDSPGGTNRNNPRFQQPAWFKNLVSAGAKPSTSTTLEIGDNQVQKPQQERRV